MSGIDNLSAGKQAAEWGVATEAGTGVGAEMEAEEEATRAALGEEAWVEGWRAVVVEAAAVAASVAAQPDYTTSRGWRPRKLDKTGRDP